MSVPDQPVESAEVPDAAVPVPEVPDPPSESASPSSIADGVERPLDPRAVAVQRIAGWLVAGPILAALLLALVLVLVLAPLSGWAMALLVHGLRILYMRHTHVLDLLGREKSELDLLY